MAARTISALPLRDAREDVAQEVDPAALPGGAQQDRADGPLEALVGIADTTSRTPPRPRARSERRKAVQKAPSSLSPTAEPEDLALAVWRSPRWR